MSRAFADNLKAYRIRANMSQADLAKTVDLTRSSVNNYETNKSEPSFEVLCKFSEVLGVDIADLLSETHEIPNFIRRVQVTDDELGLLQAYRGADPVYQSVALKLLRDNKRK